MCQKSPKGQGSGTSLDSRRRFIPRERGRASPAFFIPPGATPMSVATMPPEASTAENWTLRDVARYLCVSERTVTTYVKTGKVPTPRRLGGKWLFDAKAVRAVLGA